MITVAFMVDNNTGSCSGKCYILNVMITVALMVDDNTGLCSGKCYIHCYRSHPKDGGR